MILKLRQKLGQRYGVPGSEVRAVSRDSKSALQTLFARCFCLLLCLVVRTGKLSTFRERPLLPELLAYSGQDVHILHSLLKVLEPYNTDECVAEMVQRLGQSGDPSWNPSAGVVLARNPFHTSRKKDTRKSKGRPKK